MTINRLSLLLAAAAAVPLPAFAARPACAPAQKMYLPPAQRVRIW